MNLLTQYPMIANLCLPLPHVAVGILTARKGRKRPLLNVVFLYPSKTQALICLVLSVLVGCIKQPLKRLACSFAGSENLIHSTAKQISLVSGGYLLHKGGHNHATK